MNRTARFAILSLLLSNVMWSCTAEPDTFEVLGDESFLIGPQGDLIQYQVDSLVFDPAVGGTAQIRSTSTWITSSTNTDFKPEEDTYRVLQLDNSGAEVGDFLWRWDVSGQQLYNTQNGVNLLSLVAPFTLNTTWDPLLLVDDQRQVIVAGEPIAVYKSWGAQVDSAGQYSLPNGTTVEAVWISLADSENLLELRQVQEVYGAGVGLLERHIRIFDTQQTGSTAAWEEKAERGFSIKMVRTR